MKENSSVQNTARGPMGGTADTKILPDARWGFVGVQAGGTADTRGQRLGVVPGDGTRSRQQGGPTPSRVGPVPRPLSASAAASHAAVMVAVAAMRLIKFRAVPVPVRTAQPPPGPGRPGGGCQWRSPQAAVQPPSTIQCCASPALGHSPAPPLLLRAKWAVASESRNGPPGRARPIELGLPSDLT